MNQIRISRLAPPVILLSALLGIAAIGFGLPATRARALSNCTVSDSALALDAQESAFLGLINTYRSQNGLQPLGVSTNLNRASAWLAADMGARAYFSHTDLSGRSPSQRAVDCGYPSGAGENIAAGTVWDTAQEAFDAWRNSAGHNANMLNGSYRQIGIARAYTAGSPYSWYWVTDFGLVNDGSGGGGATSTPTQTPPPTATPTRTATPATTAPATITSLTAGSRLPGASAGFSWSAGTGAAEYVLYAGTSQGSNNLASLAMGLNRSATITGLPVNGSTIYVRLWTRFASGGWQYVDTTYLASTTAPAAATISSPSAGSRLAGSSATFSWTAGSNAAEYVVYAGTSQGANNLASLAPGLNRSTTISGLPTNGSTIYVRLWTRFASGGWQYVDTTYLAATR